MSEQGPITRHSAPSALYVSTHNGDVVLTLDLPDEDEDHVEMARQALASGGYASGWYGLSTAHGPCNPDSIDFTARAVPADVESATAPADRDALIEAFRAHPVVDPTLEGFVQPSHAEATRMADVALAALRAGRAGDEDEGHPIMHGLTWMAERNTVVGYGSEEEGVLARLVATASGADTADDERLARETAAKLNESEPEPNQPLCDTCNDTGEAWDYGPFGSAETVPCPDCVAPQPRRDGTP